MHNILNAYIYMHILLYASCIKFVYRTEGEVQRVVLSVGCCATQATNIRLCSATAGGSAEEMPGFRIASTAQSLKQLALNVAHVSNTTDPHLWHSCWKEGGLE